MYACLILILHCCHMSLAFVHVIEILHCINSVKIILTVRKVVPQVVTVVPKPGTWQQEIQYAYPNLLKMEMPNCGSDDSMCAPLPMSGMLPMSGTLPMSGMLPMSGT